jgi:hypothetical protein
MYPIASYTVGAGGASSFNFTNIPQTFTHLQLRVFIKTSVTGNVDTIFMQPNADFVASHYYGHVLFGNGSSVSSANFASTSVTAYGTSPDNTSSSNIFGVAIIDILDYTNTNKYKTMRTLNGFDANGSGQVALSSMLWQNTAAITQLTGGANAGILQYTRFDLYGIQTSNATGA